MKTFAKIAPAAVLFIFIGMAGRAQTETPQAKNASALFEQKFNAGDFDGIFAQFDANMQKALPIDQTRSFLSSLQETGGKIIKRVFTGYERGSYAAYKTNFEKAVLSLRISTNDEGKINGLYAGQYTENTVPKPERNAAKFTLPFKGQWTVTWGGDTKEQNYHVESIAQKNAFDFVITDGKGSSHRGSGGRNEDYYAFGQQIIAPCAGEVVLVVDGVKDNEPGTVNPVYVPGNTVIIKTGPNEYAFFAHFKQHTIAVKQGQQVKPGEPLGLCGNTGNSTEPHLHFHLQNIEDLNTATGIKCYFDQVVVNGTPKHDYSPVQKDQVGRR